jgi:hypothetical protein
MFIPPPDAPHAPTVIVPRRRRPLAVLVLAAAVPVVALALIQRSDPSAPTAAPTPLVPALAPGPAPSSTTTTLAPIPAELLGEATGIRLVVAGVDGTTLFDLDSGAVSAAPGFANGNIIPVEGGAILGGQGALATFMAPFDGEPRVLGLFRNSTVLASAHAGRAWVVTSDPTTTAQEVAFDGSVTVPPFPLPVGTYAAGAVDGGLLVGLHGSMYVVDADHAPRALGAGEPVAASADTIAAVVCDDRVACSLTLIDVTSGARRVVSDVTVGRDVARASFSPDGDRLAVYDSVQGVAAPTLVDVRTGSTVALTNEANTYEIRSLAWSPSGEWLFWLAGSTVRATRRDGGATFEIVRAAQPIFAVYALEGS